MSGQGNANQELSPEDASAPIALTGQVTVDLSSYNVPSQPYPCEIRCDVIGRPEIIDIQLPHSAPLWNELNANPSALRDVPLTATLTDGRILRAAIEVFARWRGDLAQTVWGRFHISDSVIGHNGPQKGDHWRIRLTNIRIPRGDKTTRVDRSDGMDFLHGSIAFDVADREWLLTDEWELRWRNGPAPDTSKPLPSGCLVTPFRQGDTREAIEAVADEIEALLRVALSRGITWFACELLANGQVVESHLSASWTKPFHVDGSQVISNDLPFQLKNFLEIAHPKFVANRDWFMLTTLLYVISRMGSHLEIRSALQNTLLDRMAAKVLEEDIFAEIDSELPQRLTSEWQDRLHKLMLEASPHWTQERTTQLISNVKGWNANPSFPGGVERAATRLGLWPPKKANLAKRHKLIHLGEYDSRKGPGVFDYWREIECLVTMMLLRLLGYSGPFYHVAIGHAQRRLGDLLLGGTDSPPYRTQTLAPDGVASLTEIAAHRLWEERDMPLGDDWTDWFTAEANIKQVQTEMASAHPGSETSKK